MKIPAVIKWFRLIAGKACVHVHHSAFASQRTLCGKRIKGQTETQIMAKASIAAVEAFRRTTCGACRRSFHPSVVARARRRPW